MTTREIYFKELVLSDLSKGRVGFVVKNKDGIIQIGKDICLEFSTNKEIIEKSINKMRNIENDKEFQFWNRSPEGEEFFKINRNSISELLTNIILNQK